MEIILSICFPTYNRGWCLEEQIKRLKDLPKELNDKIEIIISDNCSTDNTQCIVEDAIKEGFRCSYYRNSENLGMDGNFVSCFKKAKGKYVWLLGDDDIILIDSLHMILNYLESDDFGLLHLFQKKNESNNQEAAEIITDKDEFCKKMSYFSTFISANIVRTCYVPEIDFERYMGTWFTLMPLYIRAIDMQPQNAIAYFKVFEQDKDSSRNGGYNIFKVFITNYLNIWKEARKGGVINNTTYSYIKKDVFDEKIVSAIIDFLVFHKSSNFKTDGAWIIIFKNYGTNYYLYTSLLKRAVSYVWHKISKYFKTKTK